MTNRDNFVKTKSPCVNASDNNLNCRHLKVDRQRNQVFCERYNLRFYLIDQIVRNCIKYQAKTFKG